MLKKLLVPVDGSPQSVKAVKLATDLASRYDAEIVLLHVLLRGHMPDGLKRALNVEVGRTRPHSNNMDLVIIPQEIMARVDRAGETQLSLAELQLVGKYVLSNVETICKDAGVTRVTRRVEEGDPARLIVSVAEEVKPDMIVMGSRGLSNLKGILIGSVSHKVSQLAKCTCVTVR
jgi:nucleotide-binding universal stress UspA family protein